VGTPLPSGRARGAFLLTRVLAASNRRRRVDLGRITSGLGRAWGFEHAVRLSLKVRASLPGRVLPEQVRTAVTGRIAAIVAALDVGSKSLPGVPARGGGRVRWYELPEGVRR